MLRVARLILHEASSAFRFRNNFMQSKKLCKPPSRTIEEPIQSDICKYRVKYVYYAQLHANTVKYDVY